VDTGSGYLLIGPWQECSDFSHRNLLVGVAVGQSNKGLKATVCHPFGIETRVRKIDQVRHPRIGRHLRICRIAGLTGIEFHPTKHYGLTLGSGYEVGKGARSLQNQIIAEVRSGPRFLDSGLSESSTAGHAAAFAATSKYTAFGVRRSSAA